MLTSGNHFAVKVKKLLKQLAEQTREFFQRLFNMTLLLKDRKTTHFFFRK